MYISTFIRVYTIYMYIIRSRFVFFFNCEISLSFRACYSTGRLAAPIHQPWPLDAMCFSGFRLAVAATGPSCTFISLIDVPRKFWVKREILVVEVGFTEASRLFFFFFWGGGGWGWFRVALSSPFSEEYLRHQHVSECWGGYTPGNLSPGPSQR